MPVTAAEACERLEMWRTLAETAQLTKRTMGPAGAVSRDDDADRAAVTAALTLCQQSTVGRIIETLGVAIEALREKAAALPPDEVGKRRRVRTPPAPVPEAPAPARRYGPPAPA